MGATRTMPNTRKGNLTARFVATVTEPGRHTDGPGAHGLAILVTATGAKCWVQRIVIQSKRCQLGLGGYPIVSLAEARVKAFENHKLARAGGDPLAFKRRADVPTFAEAAEKVHAIHRPTWKNDRHAASWLTCLREYAFPRIGDQRVSDVTARDVMAILLPIWHTRAETARRVRQRIGTVMKWAITQGFRSDNPAGEAVGAALPRNTSGPPRHHRALPYDEVAGALATVRASSAGMAVRLAFEFLVLTAARSGEVRLATWNEIDFGARTWTVPGERMKAGREHRVPLAPRAVEVLHETRMLRDESQLLFPGTRRGRPLSDMTLSKLLRGLGINAVPHGFRSSFRDWAGETTGFPREVLETALAHVNPNKVEAAYARSDLFERRRELMEAWSRYLDPATAAVVGLGGRRAREGALPEPGGTAAGLPRHRRRRRDDEQPHGGRDPGAAGWPPLEDARRGRTRASAGPGARDAAPPAWREGRSRNDYRPRADHRDRHPDRPAVLPVMSAEEALDRLAAAARRAPGGERSNVERDVAVVRAALEDRAAAWRIADAASEAARDERRAPGRPMGGVEA